MTVAYSGTEKYALGRQKAGDAAGDIMDIYIYINNNIQQQEWGFCPSNAIHGNSCATPRLKGASWH